MKLFEIIVLAVILAAIFYVSNRYKTKKIDKDEIEKIRQTGEIPNFTNWQFRISMIPIIVVIVMLILVIIYFFLFN